MRGGVETAASLRTRYAMYGALFGAALPIFGTLLRLHNTGASISIEAIARAQRDPVLWLLDLMPALTTIIGLMVGSLRDSLSLANATVAAAQNDVRVATRALEDTAQQSIQRQAELTRAQNDLDRFAQVAANDLGAPLHAINSLAEWVREDLGSHLTHDGHQHLQLLQMRAHRMAALLNSLQSYTLAGREMGPVEPVDVRLLAHQILQQVPGGKSFIMSFDGPAESLHTARGPLTTVLHVLLHNCVVHHDMPPGRIFIEVRVEGAHVAMVVADDGPGIPAEHHERVFGLFATLDERDLQPSTTGAGLAVAKRVVETVGGQIAILPHEGRGTRVRFTWPREQTAEPHAADVLARLSLKALSAKKESPPSQR